MDVYIARSIVTFEQSKKGMRNMTRTLRRHGSKSYRRIRIRNGQSRHHRLPRSRGGGDDPDNISVVSKKLHEKYHGLFGNATAEEIVEIMNKVWLDPCYKLVLVAA